MKNIEQFVERTQAQTRPADAASIYDLEQRLGFALSDEYRAYLSGFGVIVHDGHEVYGLGVPADYYLNVSSAYADLSRDPTYPKRAVPLIDAGDGHYYLYDNQTRHVLLWATPNGGVIRTIDQGLEDFIVAHVFGA